MKGYFDWEKLIDHDDGSDNYEEEEACYDRYGKIVARIWYENKNWGWSSSPDSNYYTGHLHSPEDAKRAAEKMLRMWNYKKLPARLKVMR